MDNVSWDRLIHTDSDFKKFVRTRKDTCKNHKLKLVTELLYIEQKSMGLCPVWEPA